MRRFLSTALSLMFVLILAQSCNLNDVGDLREKPCLEAHAEKAGDKAQAEPVGNQFSMDLIVKFTRNGAPVVQKIGKVNVKDYCGGCYVDYQITNECWQLIEGKVWYGKNLQNLTAIDANPEDFPVSIDKGKQLNFPYDPAWFCGDPIYISVNAKVKYVCDEENICGAASSDPIQFFSAPLIWGQRTEVGTISAAVTGENLIVKYSIAPLYRYFWDFTKVRIDYASSKSGLHTMFGYPNLFSFDIQIPVNPKSDEATVIIPLSDLEAKGINCNQDFVMAAYAEICYIKSVWGQGTKYGALGHSMYFTLKYPCIETNENCEFPAWGEATPFSDFGINRWGYYTQYNLQCGE